MKTGTEQCTYTHDVSADRFADLSDETWQCPHQTHAETAYCPFHLPEEHDARRQIDYQSLFLTTIDSPPSEFAETNDQARILGARFPAISLRFSVINGDHQAPIDLRESTFDGHLDLYAGRIHHDLWLDGSEFNSAVKFTDATISGALRAVDCSFSASLQCEDATVAELDLSDTTVESTARFRNAVIEQAVTCRNAEIDRLDMEGVETNGDVNLTELTTTSRVRLDSATIGNRVMIFRATLPNGLWAVGLTAASGVAAGDTHFDGPVHLDDTTLGGQSRLNAVTFADRMFLRDSDVETLVVGSTTFADEVGFANSTCETAKFRSTSFNGPAEFDDVEMNSLVFVPEQIPRYVTFQGAIVTEEAHVAPEMADDADTGYWVDWRDSEIGAGTLAQPTAGHIVYNLADAKVGDISVRDDSSKNTLGWINIRQTSFNGFDFGTYRRELDDAGWRLHELNPPARELRQSIDTIPDTPETQPEILETTYLKARTESSNQGDNEATSRFFRQEMWWRRQRHWAQAVTDHSIRRRSQGLGRGLYNWVLGAMTGHGELSRRVIYSSAVIIILFALVYRTVYGAAFGDVTGLSYFFIFSGQTFITFLVGTSPVSSPLGLQVLTVLEGFIGAFFVALFVFTLTRSVSR